MRLPVMITVAIPAGAPVPSMTRAPVMAVVVCSFATVTEPRTSRRIARRDIASMTLLLGSTGISMFERFTGQYRREGSVVDGELTVDRKIANSGGENPRRLVGC